MLCPDCQLTPAAANIMRRALEDMQRTRADDPSWRPLMCGRCGDVTGIADDRDRWVFGMDPRPAAVAFSA
ncbi:MAG: hypothetical protein ABR600_04460 [Actinomycetota bacterium]